MVDHAAIEDDQLDRVKDECVDRGLRGFLDHKIPARIIITDVRHVSTEVFLQHIAPQPGLRAAALAAVALFAFPVHDVVAVLKGEHIVALVIDLFDVRRADAGAPDEINKAVSMARRTINGLA